MGKVSEGLGIVVRNIEFRTKIFLFGDMREAD